MGKIFADRDSVTWRSFFTELSIKCTRVNTELLATLEGLIMAEARSKRARRAVLRGDELPSLAPTTHRIVPSAEEMRMWEEDTSIVIEARYLHRKG